MTNQLSNKENFIYKRNLICFLAGRVSSDLATSVFKFAVSLYILKLTGSAGIFSTIIAIGMIPSIIINVFAGVPIDKSNKKIIIIATDLISAAIMIVFSTIHVKNSENLYIYVLCLIGLGILQAIDGLTIFASIPNFFSKDKVLGVNSSFQSIGAIVNILGPIFGGLLFNYVGFENIIKISALVYIFSGVIEFFLIYNKNQEISKEGYFTDFKFVYTYIKKEKTIFKLLIVVLSINFVCIPLTAVVLPYFGNNILKVSSSELGALQSAWSVGIIIGALITSVKAIQSTISKKLFVFLQIQGIAVLLWSVPYYLFISKSLLIHILIVFGVILVICGALNSVINIPMLTYIQIHVPENIRSSIYGVVNTCVTIAAPIGIWLYGQIIEKLDIKVGIFFSGAAIILVGFLANRSKDIRTFFTKNKIQNSDQ